LLEELPPRVLKYVSSSRAAPETFLWLFERRMLHHAVHRCCCHRLASSDARSTPEEFGPHQHVDRSRDATRSAVCPCSLHFLASAFTAPVLFWPGTCPSPHCCGDLPFLSMVVSCHAFTAALLYCLFKRRIGTWFVFHAGPTALLGALTLLSRIGDVSLGPIALALAASVTRCWRSFIFISRRFCTWFYVVDLPAVAGCVGFTPGSLWCGLYLHCQMWMQSTR